MAEPAPGWYPNPDATESARYWDGARWTDHVRPWRPTQPPETQTAAEPTIPAAGEEAPRDTVVLPEPPGDAAPPAESGEFGDETVVLGGRSGAERDAAPEPPPPPPPTQQNAGADQATAVTSEPPGDAPESLGSSWGSEDTPAALEATATPGAHPATDETPGRDEGSAHGSGSHPPAETTHREEPEPAPGAPGADEQAPETPLGTTAVQPAPEISASERDASAEADVPPAPPVPPSDAAAVAASQPPGAGPQQEWSVPPPPLPGGPPPTPPPPAPGGAPPSAPPMPPAPPTGLGPPPSDAAPAPPSHGVPAPPPPYPGGPAPAPPYPGGPAAAQGWQQPGPAPYPSSASYPYPPADRYPTGGAKSPENTGVAALVLGIVAFPLLLLCFVLAIPTGIAAVVVGVVGISQANRAVPPRPKGMAIAGTALGGVAILLSLLLVLLLFPYFSEA